MKNLTLFTMILVLTAAMALTTAIAQQEAPQPASRFVVSGTDGAITSGQTRTITATVYSENNTPVRGVQVSFAESSDIIAFSLSNGTTNNSGQVSTTLRTGGKGHADFRVAVSGGLTQTFSVTVEPDTHTDTLHLSRAGIVGITGLILETDLLEDDYRYDWTFTFTFPGEVVDWGWRSVTSRVNVKRNDVYSSGDTVYVPVSTAVKGFPSPSIELWVTATYEVTAPSPGHPAGHSQEDINRDGVVNIQDLQLVASRFGESGANDADINDDGVVNIQDLVLVAAALGAAGAPSGNSHSFEELTAADVQLWVKQVQSLGLADSTSHRGIAVLELLAALLQSEILPQENALLPNYPNPFNPETWIPYRLAESAEVTLSIYSLNGNRVRTLALGHQPAGFYESRSRAAYWDGRNAIGERVASGVYFYTLTAGDFAATDKMLILK